MPKQKSRDLFPSANKKSNKNEPLKILIGGSENDSAQ
jgi:hypothetical protein